MKNPNSFAIAAIGVELREATPLFCCTKPSYTGKFSNFMIEHQVKAWQVSLIGVKREAN